MIQIQMRGINNNNKRQRHASSIHSAITPAPVTAPCRILSYHAVKSAVDAGKPCTHARILRAPRTGKPSSRSGSRWTSDFARGARSIALGAAVAAGCRLQAACCMLHVRHYSCLSRRSMFRLSSMRSPGQLLVEHASGLDSSNASKHNSLGETKRKLLATEHHVKTWLPITGDQWSTAVRWLYGWHELRTTRWLHYCTV